MPLKTKKKMNLPVVPNKKKKVSEEMINNKNKISDHEDIDTVGDDNSLENENSYEKLMGSFERSHKKILSNLLTSHCDEPNGGQLVSNNANVNSSKLSVDNFSSDEDHSENEEDEDRDVDDNSDSDDDEYDVVDEEKTPLSHQDPFNIRFEETVNEDVMEEIMKSKFTVTEKKKVTSSEEICMYTYPPEIMENLKPYLLSSSIIDPDVLFRQHIKKHLIDQWNQLNVHKKKKSSLTGVQQHIFPYILSYQDLYYTNRNFNNAEEIRKLYCLHAVNHVLKSVSKVLKNNKKLQIAQAEGKEIEECRDQGLTRPKVLIMVPFKDSCYKCVNNIIKTILKSSKGQVMNKKRFQDEFAPPTDVKESKNKPDDFKQMFHGNIDDCFRIGLSINKKKVKLYSDFYASDIIIASPLGLRTIIGTESEAQDFDFLSSIEILIMDQTDVFLMQNWEHVLHVMEHMNKLPKKSRDTDFSRVRMWAINNWRQYYRQTLLFSSLQTPEINSIFNKFCHIDDLSGKIKRFVYKHAGYARQIATPLKQVYYKCECVNHEEAADARFQYFVDRILPMYRTGTSSNIGIFVPSYFDFVRLRNYFKREEISFVQISEYSQRANISTARNLFQEKRKSFIIFTERFYFFYRYKIRGIRTMIFYQLPQYPQFYAELVNFMETRDKLVSDSTVSCVVLFSQFDGSRLEDIVGTERCRRMLASDKRSFMLLTES